MYFWDVERLKQELVLGSTPAQSFRYLLALVLAPEAIYFVLSIGFAGLARVIDFDSVVAKQRVAAGPVEENLTWDAARALLTAAVWFVGLLHCYRVNGGSAGRDFLPRLAALAWVATIRVHVLFVFPLLFVRGVVMNVVDGVRDEAWTFFVLPAVTTAAILWRTGKHLGEVATGAARG